VGGQVWFEERPQGSPEGRTAKYKLTLLPTGHGLLDEGWRRAKWTDEATSCAKAGSPN